jgi:hypothetical protein
MLPSPTAEPAAAKIKPILLEKLPLFAIVKNFGKIDVKPLVSKGRRIG